MAHQEFYQIHISLFRCLIFKPEENILPCYPWFLMGLLSQVQMRTLWEVKGALVIITPR